MSTVRSVLTGGITVITDIVSANVLAQLLLLTTQPDLIIALALESILLLQYADELLTRFFSKSSFFSDHVERMLMRFVYVIRMACVFVLVRVGMAAATEILETSATRWHELAIIIVLTFGFIFILFERSNTAPVAETPPPPPKKTT